MKAVRQTIAFTLIELLVVISILGLVAAIAVPAIKNFGRADAAASASRQLLDDIGWARQLAISQRSPVFMVFVPANFWDLPGYSALYSALPQTEKDKADRLFDKQLNSYALVALGGVGDQPGQHSPRYLSPWRSLPDGNFIALRKFGLRAQNDFWMVDSAGQALTSVYGLIKGFNLATNIPFPSEDAAHYVTTQSYPPLPYIAFDYNGQVDSREDEFIPLARGTIAHALDPETRNPMAETPSVSENPPGNSTNSFNLIHIDWLTGRARVERPQVQ